MSQFDIYITCVSWGSGSKNRPILVFLFNDTNVLVYPITTRFANKSKEIQKQYFKINEWSKASLERLSYIDTGTLIKLPLTAISGREPIGRLTTADKQRLLDFLLKN